MRAGGMAQEVEHFPSKHKALSSNSNKTKKRSKDRKKEGREGGKEGGREEGRKGRYRSISPRNTCKNS
jgi:hypothetical protein